MEKNIYENMFTEYPDIITVEELQKMLRIGRNAAYGMMRVHKGFEHASFFV